MTIDQQSTISKKSPKIHIETWGCQMNVADSEKMLSLMASENYSRAIDANDADLIILNTCHIREKARHKVVSRLGRLKELKELNPGLTIAVTGCVAQAEGKSLIASVPMIDVIVGPGKIDDLPALVAKHKATGERDFALGFRKAEADHNHLQVELPAAAQVLPSLDGKNEVSRYINIQQGCDNFCTFCVVPFTRGREVSESPDSLVEKVRAYAAQGITEIMLLGQNVNSYGLDLVRDGKLALTDRGPFADLLARVCAIPELNRVRFTTSNPHDFTKHLAELFGTEPKMGRYIHLPVQSGSDRLLQEMKRKVTVAEYWERVQWLRAAVPDIAISTDLIVGFPGETEEDFAGTYELVKELRYSFIFAFKYSPRKGTAAARFRDQVEEATMSQRLARLNTLQDKITLELNEAEVGQDREVLFLYESKRDPGIFYGRTPHFRLVRAASKHDIVGKTRLVRIETFNKTALTGVALD
jgi:tRNA-2-methylthio-N6-dimethylallyladenosine synthase